jgi:ribose transport system permease protein
MLTIGILTNVLDSRAIDTNWQSVVKGCIIIAAVGLDVLGRSRK